MGAVPASQRAGFARAAFLWACGLDVQVRKPGNVSVASPGHGMDGSQFLRSAAAAAGPLCAANLPVGERIEEAVRGAWEATGCNTNLGIVLLCAPLFAACERCEGAPQPDGLRAALEAVLRSLTVDDARAAYRAIALARPAGLGRVSEQDVHAEPTVTLREAMALAADRDRIAWQYTRGYPDVFELGLPTFLALPSTERAMQATFLQFLASLPDSHIVRKHGHAVAQSVMREAQPWRARAAAGEALESDPAFAHWDQDLKARGVNPGTSADLCVAVALAAALTGTSRFH